MENNFTPKKDYNAPMHTAEHILNQTMIRMFDCKRSNNTHIEKNKSKCDYILASAPTAEQMLALEKRTNEIISQNLDVTEKLMPLEEAAKLADTSKLPAGIDGPLRVIFVGDYDACPCIGAHVENTSEIGRVAISSYDYADGRLRIRYKLESK